MNRIGDIEYTPDDSNALAFTDNDRARFGLARSAPADWLEVEAKVRELYAEGVSDIEWEIYKSEAKAYGLDPIKREFIPLMIGSKKVQIRDGARVVEKWEKQYRGYVTQAGMIALAERSGQLDGIEGPLWAGDHTNNQFVEYWLPEWGVPHAARVTVFRKDTSRGTTAVVTMARARTVWDNDKKARVIAKGPWSDDPAMMLGVRATTDALRKSGILSAIPDYEKMRLAALAAGGGVLALGTGEEEEEERVHEISASRRLHAVAGARGLEHGDARKVVAHLIPEIGSLADAEVEDLQATADYIELAEAEDLAEMTDRESGEIVGEARRIAPEPNQKPLGTEITQEQIDWFDKHAGLIDWNKVPEDLAQQFADREVLTFNQATALMFALERIIAESAMDTDWSAFWRGARAAGFKSAAAISEALEGEPIADTIPLAYDQLGRAIATKSANTKLARGASNGGK